MGFISGLFIGTIIGILALALVSTERRRRARTGTINDCEACKASLCGECDVSNKAQKAKEDWESLWEELQHCKREKDALKRSRAQVAGAHSRVLHELWSAQNMPSRGEG